MFARSFMGFVMVPALGYIAVCFASPAAWVAADLFLVPAYLHVMKDLEKLFGKEEEMKEVSMKKVPKRSFSYFFKKRTWKTS